MQTINFNKKIYQLEAIKKSTEEFKDLAEIKIENDQDYIKVSFDKIDAEYQGVIKDEFANYVLGLLS